MVTRRVTRTIVTTTMIDYEYNTTHEILLGSPDNKFQDREDLVLSTSMTAQHLSTRILISNEHAPLRKKKNHQTATATKTKTKNQIKIEGKTCKRSRGGRSIYRTCCRRSSPTLNLKCKTKIKIKIKIKARRD